MIKLIRVDDRLIHGQVVSSWVRSNGIQVIVVVDDNIAKDKVQQSILKMAAPPGIKIYSLPEDVFLEKFNQGILDKYVTMLLFADVTAVLRLVKNGFKIETLNLGGIRMRPGRVNYTKAISLDKEEKEAILELDNLGVKHDLRLVISDSNIDIVKLIKQKEGD